MPFLNPTCDMNVNCWDKHKHKAPKQIQNKTLRIVNFKNP